MKNKLKKMFDVEKIKRQIQECPKDETILLSVDWTGFRPEYTKEELKQLLDQDDLEQFEREIGLPLIITENDYLVLDPHGILLE